MFLGINFKKLVKSFGFAIIGIKTILREENAFKAMVFVSFLVVIGMFYFNLPLTQKVLLFSMIVLVLVLELMNSVIEKLLDFISPSANGKVKVIKDVFAGIVLLACIGAAAIGILLFIPYF
jgi:diacylglycerol kinase